MLAQYLEACLPARSTILGQQLRPLSLGHLRLLHRLGNTFVTSRESLLKREPAVIAGDLLKGIWICSQTHDEIREALESDRLAADMAEWLKAIEGKFDPVEKSIAFALYIQDGQRWPDFEINETDGKSQGQPIRSPIIQQVLSTVCRHCGYARADALDCPWTELLWDYCAYLEERGVLRLVSTQEREDEAQRDAEINDLFWFEQCKDNPKLLANLQIQEPDTYAKLIAAHPELKAKGGPDAV